MVNATKQANEFGLTRAGQTDVSLLTFITEVNSVGLKAMQGLTFITAFYWDRDDESRAWSKRFFELHKRVPTMAHAAIYSAIRHHLRAIEAAGTDEAKAVMAKMREIPVNDFYAKNGGYAKTAAWCTTCTSCRSKRRRNRTARGTTTRSCRPFQAIKLFVLGRRRMSAGPTAIGGYAASTGVHPSLMTEVITHAEPNDQWSKLFCRRTTGHSAAVGDPGGSKAHWDKIRLRSRPLR
jgi:hypothetical protein